MHSRPNRQWKIGTVENCRHHWYLLIWIVYFVLFYIAEHVVTDHYWVSICRSTTRSHSAGILSFPTVCGTRCCLP